jgi:hypothetical protein
MWGGHAGSGPPRAVLYGGESNRIATESFDVEDVALLKGRTVLKVQAKAKSAWPDPTA